LPKRIPENTLTAIEEAVRLHPDGADLPEIAIALKPSVPKRTLQYRLKYLVDAGRLVKVGDDRWAKYRLRSAEEAEAGAVAADKATAVAAVEKTEEAAVPLSPTSKEMRAYLSRPLNARQPVGYNREFLDSYRPNETFYLSEEQRGHLAEVGKPNFDDQAAGTYAKQILNRLLIDLSWNSSRLEGNTYSLLDTTRLIELGEAAEGRDSLEAQMIVNHKEAIEFLVNDAEAIGFNRYTILNLHGELYTPSTATFATTGSMSATRSAPAILLGNGKVLVAGGYSCDSNGNCASLKSAEIYDPVSGTFSSAGNMTIDRYGHMMTLMSSGQVLIAGGEMCSSATSCSALSAAELYDPVAGTFTATGNLNAARFNASAVALNSGLVLIVGGNYPAAGELYDPVAATFSNTPANLNTPRANATATLLNGEVLIAGGSTCATPGCPTSVAELYDNGSFYYFSYPTSNMTVSRWDQTATLLTNGQVLLVGGYDSCASSCISDRTTELFNPQSESFTSSQALSTGRSGHTATLLTDGSVLIVGGINNGVTLSSTDSYQPSSLALPQLAVITIAPY